MNNVDCTATPVCCPGLCLGQDRGLDRGDPGPVLTEAGIFLCWTSVILAT